MTFKGYDFLEELKSKNNEFNDLVNSSISNGKVRFFNDNEWNKIKTQNYISLTEGIDEFYDIFSKGYNKGNCVGTSWQLSFSYDDVDIVSGILPVLKGTLNAEEEGGHCWLETDNFIIDTSFLLVIDKSLKENFGYIEEQRVTASMLRKNENYQMRKELINDGINGSKKNSI